MKSGQTKEEASDEIVTSLLMQVSLMSQILNGVGEAALGKDKYWFLVRDVEADVKKSLAELEKNLPSNDQPR
tara:strand:+ start:279 stop:494 length:216 start_codon:yes stop_codon:yes gene_type:complete